MGRSGQYSEDIRGLLAWGRGQGTASFETSARLTPFLSAV